MTAIVKPISTLAQICTQAEKLRLQAGTKLGDAIVADIYANAETIARKVVVKPDNTRTSWETKLDDILTSRIFGYPIMLSLLGMIFWITIVGANIPSGMIADALFLFQDQLTEWFQLAGAPDWLHGVLVLGMYRGLAWVVSVMLPPMAIFFPLFTLLEDLGYLPRVAFNLDHAFKKCKASGKDRKSVV